jgi:organic hydroperoxide reductase OsmC/OhrA
MAIAPFPHTYTVTLANGELGASPRAPIAAGTPPQFGGSDAVWSPEELLVGAALLCLQTTFESMARRESLAIHGWNGVAHGMLDRTSEGPAFSVIRMEVELVTAIGDESRAEAVLRNAEKRCIIGRALKAPIELAVRVRPIALAS